MLETLEGTRQILREGEGGRGLCIHAEHTRTSGSVPLVILSLTSPRSHFDIAGQNCGIKMVFLVKFLGVLVLDIAWVKMGSHSLGNILHLWGYAYQSQNFKLFVWTQATSVMDINRLVFKVSIWKYCKVVAFNLLVCMIFKKATATPDRSLCTSIIIVWFFKCL